MSEVKKTLTVEQYEFYKTQATPLTDVAIMKIHGLHGVQLNQWKRKNDLIGKKFEPNVKTSAVVSKPAEPEVLREKKVDLHRATEEFEANKKLRAQMVELKALPAAVPEVPSIEKEIDQEPLEPTIEDEVLASVREMLKAQNRKGLQKYGRRLDDAPPGEYSWPEMINEELIDALQYQRKQIRELLQANSLAARIRSWSQERELHNGDPFRQLAKVGEELGELSRALLRSDEPETMDALGDLHITLVILAQQLGYELENCTDTAFEVIKDRQGKMVAGTFIKEADFAEVSEQ